MRNHFHAVRNVQSAVWWCMSLYNLVPLGVTVASHLNPPGPGYMFEALAFSHRYPQSESQCFSQHWEQLYLICPQTSLTDHIPHETRSPETQKTNLARTCWVCVLHSFQFIKMNFNISIRHACCSCQHGVLRCRDDVQQAEKKVLLKTVTVKLTFCNSDAVCAFQYFITAVQ